MAKCQEAQGTTNSFEKEVYDFLCSHLPDEYVVLGSLQIGSRQFDILVIGPNGIFPVEAKGLRGIVQKERVNDQLVVINAKGEAGTFKGRHEPPETQAQNQAKKIMRFLESDLGLSNDKRPWVKPILVFPAGNEIHVPLKNRDKNNTDIIPFVLTLDEVPEYITGFPTKRRSLPQDVIEALAEAFLRDGDDLPDKYWEILRRWNTSRTAQKRNRKAGPFPAQYRSGRRRYAGLWFVMAAVGLLGVFLIIGFGILAVWGMRLEQPQSPATLTLPSLSPSPSPSPSPFVPTPSPQPMFTPTTVSLASTHITSTPTAVRQNSEGEWSNTVAGLTLTITKIEPLNHGFRVWMTATNETKDTLALPLFMNFYVVDDLGNQYQADPFQSSFPYQIASGATVSGYALMTKPLDSRATTLKALFSVVYGSLNIRSISIEGIPAP